MPCFTPDGRLTTCTGRAALTDEIAAIDQRMAALHATRRMLVSTLNDSTPIDDHGDGV